MTTYYVGPGGNNGNNGLSWANRKLTLNGVEDVPVAAGDIVYVGPGVYRETLTIDVSGSSGSPITYIADVTGEHTDGIGGIVRITGSDDDQAVARGTCINSTTTRNFRTFRGFLFDSCSSNHINIASASTDWIIEDCFFQPGSTSAVAVLINGTGGNHKVRRCFFLTLGPAIQITHSSTVNNIGDLIENCVLFVGGNAIAIRIDRVGGVTIKNCTIAAPTCVRVQTALAGGQTVNVNNCILTLANTALVATVAGELVEDYNSVFGSTTPRTNVNTGSNSVAYPPLFDVPLMLAGFVFPVRNLATLNQWSFLANKTGSSPSSDDFYGLSRPATNSKNSWGAIQYIAALRTTSTVRNGSSALWLFDAGEKLIAFVPVTNVSTTISLYVNRQTDYAGSEPQMIIRQPGQSDRVTTDAGSANAWNQLTDTFTPAASPGYVAVFVRSRNTATSGSFSVFVDDLDVS